MNQREKKILETWAESVGIRVISKAALKKLRKAGATQSLGSGAYGSCRLLEVDKFTLVLKKFGSESAGIDLGQELRALNRCQGTGVQKLFGVCPQTGEIISHYAGRNLDHCVDGLNLAERVYVLFRVMETIDGMLQRKYCHNDIKFSNICVTGLDKARPKVTVIDLGLARKVGKSAYPVINAETAKLLLWIAPELKRGKGCSEASEVFSLGRLAIEIFPSEGDIPSHLKKWVEASQKECPGDRPSLAEGVQCVRKCYEELN